MGQPVRRSTRTRRWLRPTLAAGALAAITFLAGCGGGDGGDRSAQTGSAAAGKPVAWTLVLDYEPNAVHAGLIRAADAGYFRQAGIDLTIVAPSSTSDALTQVSRGRAQVGLADLIDVARRNERDDRPAGDDAPSAPVSVAAAIVQRPLSGLIARADGPIATPADLAGKRIAVSGLPSDLAIVHAIVRSGDRALPTKPITLGFNGLKALSSGRVDATTAYWPADAVTLESLGKKPRVFALDQFGGPRYPGLVAFTARSTAQRDPSHVQAFRDALAHGIRDVVADPQVGLDAIAKRYPELDAAATKQQLTNYRPLFGAGSTAGQVDRGDVTAFAAFAARSGLTERELTADEILGDDPSGTPTP